MTYAEFSLIRFGTGLSPRHAGAENADLLMQGLRDDAMAARYPALSTPEASQLAYAFAEAGRAAQKMGDDSPEYTRAKAALDAGAEATVRARLARALDDATGFADRLALFWAGHFTTRADSANLRVLQAAFHEDAIRAHQRGRFSELLRAATLHPAMLLYLDQSSSVGPRSPMAINQRKKRRLGLNENHARELLELHSMGVGADYSQTDVRQLARLMTGLSVNNEREFVFDLRRVEPGAETILGTRYGGAEPAQLSEIDELLDDLAVRPDTASFICTKLARHFCADDPPAGLVADMQARFKQTGGDLMAVYDVLVRHPDARDTFGQKVRQPQDLVVAGLRALGVDGAQVMVWTTPQLHQNYIQPMKRMGQNMNGASQPEGWPEPAVAWLSPQLLAARIDWAMVQPKKLMTRLPDPRSFAATALGAEMAPEVATLVARAESQADGVGLVLASPQFNRR